MKPVLGWRSFGYPFEVKAGGGILRLGRGGEEFPFEGPAIAQCNPMPLDIQKSREGTARYNQKIYEGPHTSPDPRCCCGIFAHFASLQEVGGPTGHWGVYRHWGVYVVKGYGILAYGNKKQW